MVLYTTRTAAQVLFIRTELPLLYSTISPRGVLMRRLSKAWYYGRLVKEITLSHLDRSFTGSLSICLLPSDKNLVK